MTGLAEAELLAGLRAAVEANVLVALDAPDRDGYRFRHALLAEAVLDDLLPGERRRLSRRYAEVIEASPGLVRPEERAVRLAGYWYRAQVPDRALPAVLEAIAELRERRAYAEQLELLVRAMELWDAVPEERRRDLPRPIRLAQLPPPGADPGAGTGGLDVLDLLAEAARAASIDGRGGRGLELVRQAQRLIDERTDPLRAAWFWMEGAMLTAQHGGGDGWAELARAFDLVRDTPPSAIHAEVLDHVAGWEQLHEADDNSLALGERAVEYARIAGNAEVELSARITLSNLLSHAGDADAAVAALYKVRELARQVALPRALQRANVNLTDALQRAGRSAEAVETGLAAIEELRGHGLLDAAAFTAGNVADSLIWLGDWERAEALLATWREHAQGSRARAAMQLRPAEIAVARGAYDAAAARVAAARQQVSTLKEPQFDLPIAVVELRCAAGRGHYAEALDLLQAALELLPVPGQDSYVIQLLIAGAQLTGDAAGLPGVEAGRLRGLVDRLAAAAEGLEPGWSALPAWLAAELGRARGDDTPAAWATAAAAFEPYGFPHVLARIRRGRRPGAGGAAAAPGPRGGGTPRRRPPAPGRRTPRDTRTYPAPHRGRRHRPGRAAGPTRRLRPHGSRAGRAAAGGAGAKQPADRGGTVHLSEDGQRARVPHDGQARRGQPRRGGGTGAPNAVVPGDVT